MPSQSELMWGKTSQAAPNPRADVVEFAKERGVEVIRSNDNPNFAVEVTPPVLAPAPLDMSARGQLAPRLVQAEAMVARAQAEHALAGDVLNEAQKAMVTASSGERYIEQNLLKANTDLTVAAGRLAAFVAHRDKLLAQQAAWEADGSLDAYDDACARQSGDGLMKSLAPLVKKATKLGADFGAVAVDALAIVGEVLAQRQRASGLAAKLGLQRHRDSGVNASSASLKIAAAFAEGFKAAAPKVDLKRWLLP